ncbi:MAG: hypothetical protein LC679_07595 [Intrasporangiaceae bacterium]|nr:hypothetical protein [Intrasporangiaceae bacterium]
MTARSDTPVDPKVIWCDAEHAAAVAEELARNLRRALAQDRLDEHGLVEPFTIALPALSRTAEAIAKHLRTPCDGAFPHDGPWQRLPGTDQASQCICGFISTK